MRTATLCRNEKGAALITGLVLLLVLTILGIAAMQSATLQERMAGNLEQEDLAFQAAEAGLRDAEAWITGQGASGLPEFNNSNGLYMPAVSGRPRWETVNWNDPNQYLNYQGDDLADAPYEMPRYIIEYMAHVGTSENDSVAFGSFEDDVNAYRITSRGVSPNGRSVVMLQSTFVR